MEPVQTPAVETPITAPPVVETPAPKSELQLFREKRDTPAEPVVEPPAGVEPPKAPEPVAAAPEIEKPEPEIPERERFTDPDTGEVLDMRTRRAKRIKQLLSERVQTRDEVRAMRDELAKLRGPAKEPEKPQPTTPTVDPTDPEPTLEQFADQADPYLAYSRSLARWEARQEHKRLDTERAAAARAREQQESQTKAQEAWEAKLPDVRSRYPDFDDAYNAVFDALASVAQTGDKRHRYLVNRLLISEHGHDLAYFLGKHPEEVPRLYQVRGFDEHVLAIGRLEERVVASAKAPKPAAPPVPTPPAPIAPVGGGTTTTTYDPAKANLAQYRAHKARLGVRD